ncbi:hypothetical protein EV2_029682 [Malus domestica]
MAGTADLMLFFSSAIFTVAVVSVGVHLDQVNEVVALVLLLCRSLRQIHYLFVQKRRRVHRGDPTAGRDFGCSFSGFTKLILY